MMKVKRKILKRMGICTAIVLVVVIPAIFFIYKDALIYMYLRGFVWIAVRDAQHRQVRLLCKTNHKILLDACRELSRRCARGDLKPGTYYIAYDRNPEASQFPKTILNLSPNYVYIDEDDSGRVMVEMLGGLGHFGVLAYTEDYKKPSWSVYGDKELIPGLWYYDDGYRDNPEYDKVIEELIQREKKKK